MSLPVDRPNANPLERRRLVPKATVIEIATRTLFENHTYRFGGQTCKQNSGGSIGDRWTGKAAEIVVQDWGGKSTGKERT